MGSATRQVFPGERSTPVGVRDCCLPDDMCAGGLKFEAGKDGHIREQVTLAAIKRLSL